MGRSSSREARVQAAWKADRAYLFAIAAGMLGRPAEAEDVVQEAFARLAGACIDEIEDVRGWLVVVTRRLCLDRLGSADTRRTAVTPEPPEAAQQGADPADRLALDDEIRRALAVVVDRLSPAERTSFLLHDIFGFPFGAVAELVGRTPAACRQLARRARLSIRAGSFHAGVPSSGPQGRVAADLAERFVSVCEGGDLRGLIDLLDPDVAGLATVLGLPPLPPARGASAVAERALFFFGPSAGVCLEPFTVEGRAAVVARRASHVLAVVRLDERAGRIFHMHAIARRFGPAPR
ncbi:MAG TPA: sigma-70 family RNA polymerase sigma factor [Streptosporangiaceae bacterium]|nr:sigma-70 family RNA polymerase sigma factor [Streptosporangiaceae bacterium]